jgi:hypothetical protein
MVIRILLVVVLLFAASAAFARNLERAEANGMVLTLTDERDGCEQYKEAMRARLERGKEVFLGCYVKAGEAVFILWDDGDKDQIPAKAFKQAAL